MKVTIISLRALEKNKMVCNFLLVDRRKRSNNTDDTYLPIPFWFNILSSLFCKRSQQCHAYVSWFVLKLTKINDMILRSFCEFETEIYSYFCGHIIEGYTIHTLCHRSMHEWLYRKLDGHIRFINSWWLTDGPWLCWNVESIVDFAVNNSDSFVIFRVMNLIKHNIFWTITRRNMVCTVLYMWWKTVK